MPKLPLKVRFRIWPLTTSASPGSQPTCQTTTIHLLPHLPYRPRPWTAPACPPLPQPRKTTLISPPSLPFPSWHEILCIPFPHIRPTLPHYLSLPPSSLPTPPVRFVGQIHRSHVTITARNTMGHCILFHPSMVIHERVA